MWSRSNSAKSYGAEFKRIKMYITAQVWIVSSNYNINIQT